MWGNITNLWWQLKDLNLSWESFATDINFENIFLNIVMGY